MKLKTNEATPLQLDWLVATIKGLDIVVIPERRHADMHVEYRSASTGWDFRDYSPSIDPAQGQPIIELEKIDTKWTGEEWIAGKLVVWLTGPTQLIAAMRCYVTSKLGDEVEVPEELK